MAGAIYAGLLYFRNDRLKELSPILRRFLFFFRFLLVALITFFLLDPLIRFTTRDTEKPLIIFAQDVSGSIVMGKDSAYYTNEYPGKVNALLAGLAEKYDTATYSFGESVSQGLKNSFPDKLTDISSLFSSMNDRLSNRNIGALILATDGIYNKGTNPVFSFSNSRFPVYCVALGDSAVKKDLILKNVAHNRYAYLGNSFPFEISVEAKQLKGKESILTVSKGNAVLHSEKVNFNSSSWFRNFTVRLDANTTGLQRYRISLTAIEGELSTKNNSQDVFIEVLDGRQKILILALSPHPDVAAIRSAVEKNQNYEVEAKTIDEFSGGFAQYNLVILHQLPGALSIQNKKLEALFTSDVPMLFILGSQTDVVEHARLNTGIKIPDHKKKVNDAVAVPAVGFTLFEVSGEAFAMLKKYPPLTVPFGNYKIGNSCITLCTQKIGMVNTQNPVWAFTDMNGRKTGTIAGEGLWKWKLYESSETGSDKIFSDLISKTVQYLAVKADKSQFRVYGKNNFMENEPVEFNAELYNETYELINDPDVTISILNVDGRKFPFTFSKSGRSYKLNAGTLPPGEYSYDARAKVGDKILSAKGQFSITAIQVEFVNTTADHQMLYALSEKNGGELVYPGAMQELLEKLNAREDIKTVSYTHTKLSDLINLRWIFFILLLLLTLEWFLRKRSGSY